MKKKIKNIVFPNKDTQRSIQKRNMNIILYASIVSVISRFFSIMSFNRQIINTTEGTIWKNYIIQMHTYFLVVWFIIAIFTFICKKIKKDLKYYWIIEYLTFITILGLGLCATLFDQLVTSDITAFMIASIVAPVIVFVNPVVSIITLLVNFHIFRILLPRFQLDPAIFLSNHTNALVVTFFAMFLSIVIYNYAVKNLQQEQYIQKQKEALEYLAHTDPLTDLMNRRRFIQLVKSRDDYGIIAAIDIDDFKRINDQHGHPVGDEIFKQFSKLMINYFEDDDLIARFGGEEFLILMGDMHKDDAFDILEHFRKYVEDKPFTVDETIIRFTVSIGYTCKNDDKNSFYTAYKIADKALYKVKENGKNAVLHN